MICYPGLVAPVEQDPVEGGDDVADQEEGNGRHEEVKKVEAVVLVIGPLEHLHIEVVDYSSYV